MIAVDVDASVARQAMERRQPDVVERRDRPRVAAIRVRERLHGDRTLLRPREQVADVETARRRRFERRDRRRESRPTRRTDRRVLRAYQLLRLRRPGHQLAVEADPVALELLPDAGGVERPRDAVEERRARGVVGEERPPGPGVDRAGAAVDDAET